MLCFYRATEYVFVQLLFYAGCGTGTTIFILTPEETQYDTRSNMTDLL